MLTLAHGGIFIVRFTTFMDSRAWLNRNEPKELLIGYLSA
jgi:hypothetical protein